MFAHQVVRRMVETVPALSVLMKAKTNPTELAEHLWMQTCQSCGNEPTSLTAADFRIGVMPINDEYPTLVIGMPPPSNAAEACVVAVVYDKPPPQTEANNVQHHNYRYFTLEMGALGDLIMGGWSGDAHLNFGPIGSLDEGLAIHDFVQRFLDKVGEMVAKEGIPDRSPIPPTPSASPDSTDSTDGDGMGVLGDWMNMAKERIMAGDSPEEATQHLVSEAGIEAELASMLVGLAVLAKESVEEELGIFMN